jgi:crotonobetainyl-CoA:carnitine CoA-transferase CaiB-like acyl-CoA transferase
MLEGIRVIELEGIGPGPFAGMTLADLGADVVKVHRPSSTQEEKKEPLSLLDRGKRSVILNLKEQKDKHTLKGLIKGADVLIEGHRPGVMERLGFDEKTVFELNPNIIFGRITGWGQGGPNATQAAHDLNYISKTGSLWFGSDEGDSPFTPPTMVGDIGGGALYLVIGILAALFRVKNGEKGTVVDAAIVDGTAHMMNLLLSLYPDGIQSIKRGKGLLDGPHWSRCYRCSCGEFISVQCLESKFYLIFLDVLGLSDDPGFLDQHDKTQWPMLTVKLKNIFLTQSRTYWGELFENSDSCVMPVLSPLESTNDPHMKSRNIWTITDSGLQAAPAPKFSNWINSSYQTIPTKGEHSQEILKELSDKA